MYLFGAFKDKEKEKKGGQGEQAVTEAIVPKKQIAFVGATDVGKSSTINALIGKDILPVGCEHGTTTMVRSVAFFDGYALADTPGLFDTPDYFSDVWDAIISSEIVIYTVKGQLYQREADLIDRIHHFQRVYAPQCRLALYVNKRDIAQKSITKAMREREIELIRQQVSRWIDPMNVIVGFAHTYDDGGNVSSDIEELHKLINRLMF